MNLMPCSPDPEKRAAYDQLGQNHQSGQDFRPPPNWDAGFEFSGLVLLRPRRLTTVSSSPNCSAAWVAPITRIFMLAVSRRTAWITTPRSCSTWKMLSTAPPAKSQPARAQTECPGSSLAGDPHPQRADSPRRARGR